MVVRRQRPEGFDLQDRSTGDEIVEATDGSDGISRNGGKDTLIGGEAATVYTEDRP